MELFELTRDYVVTFSPQALMLEPFKALWTRDKSKDKIQALKELSYIWFMSDYKSDFFDILDPDERMSEVKKQLGLAAKWSPDSIVITAMDFYINSSNTVSTKLLIDSMSAVDKVSKFLKDVDLTKLDKNEKPVYDAKKVADTVKAIPDLIRSLKEVEEEIKKEKETSGNMRGSKEKTDFEDGI